MKLFARIVVALALAGIASAAPALEIHFDTDTVRIHDASPGTGIHMLGAGQFLHQGLSYSFLDVTTLTPGDDGDALQWPQDHDIPILSVWLAIDAASGELALASPLDVEARTTEFPEALLDGGELTFEQAQIHLLWVRPGVGAWQIRAVDGGTGDARGAADGTLAVDLRGFAPLAAAPASEPPTDLEPGDQLAMLEPTSLTVAVLEVTREWLETARESGGWQEGSK